MLIAYPSPRRSHGLELYCQRLRPTRRRTILVRWTIRHQREGRCCGSGSADLRRDRQTRGPEPDAPPEPTAKLHGRDQWLAVTLTIKRSGDDTTCWDVDLERHTGVGYGGWIICDSQGRPVSLKAQW